MRQQSESAIQSHSGHTIQTNQARKQRIDKKRAIRKNKINNLSEEIQQIKNERRNLTKEQKAQLQKAKNREAAQKSRDQHKKYVESIMQENTKLQQQLKSRKYCQKCSKLIQIDSGQSTDQNEQIVGNSQYLDSFIQEQNNQEFQEFQTPFQRIHDYEQSSSFKMFLFISMIMIGLMLFSSGQTEIISNITLQRDLLEIKTQSKQINNKQILEQQVKIQNRNQKQIQQITKFDLMNKIQNSFNMDTANQQQKILTQIVPLTYKMSVLSQQNCLKSIINQNFTIQGFQNLHYFDTNRVAPSLRANNEVQIFSTVKSQKNQNILFCSLPKLYKKNNQIGSGLLSKFIDIIISGSEVMEILGETPNIWMNKMINLNGLYKINAEVKEIVKIQDQNCIL